MKTEEALQRTREIIRRKRLALSTEDVYCAWLKRYCQFVKKCPPHMPSQQKLERFLTALAKENVAASTQNQAFNQFHPFFGISRLKHFRPEVVHFDSTADSAASDAGVQAETSLARPLQQP